MKIMNLIIALCQKEEIAWKAVLRKEKEK